MSKPLALAGLAGAALFLPVDAVLVLTAAPLAGIENRGVGQTTGWFLNSGRGVAAMAIAFALMGALIGFTRRASVREAMLAGSGAVLAMIVMLFSIGPGTIFPIVIAFGTAMIAGATAAGTALGIELGRRAFRQARDEKVPRSLL